ASARTIHLSWLGCCVACTAGVHQASKLEPRTPVIAPVIDRFSARAGHLMLRDRRPDLPGPGQPIDLDRPPFVTQGLGPDGVPVRYYNFDVQSDVPATMYRLVHAGSHELI